MKRIFWALLFILAVASPAKADKMKVATDKLHAAGVYVWQNFCKDSGKGVIITLTLVPDKKPSGKKGPSGGPGRGVESKWSAKCVKLTAPVLTGAKHKGPTPELSEK